MTSHHLLRLGCLALAAAPALAVELPIVRVTIGPDGAVVERAGILPAGDEVVGGLPVGLDVARLAVTIAGIDTPPAIRFEVPAVASPPPPDAAWEERLATAQAAFDAAQPAFELAELRARLARAALGLLPVLPPAAAPGDGTEAQAPAPAPSAERPPTATQPVPSAAAQAALLGFVTANLQRAEGERAGALRARSQARAQLIALDEERERARPPAVYAARLPLPGAGGHEVRLRYAVERAAWAPVYRIAAEGGQVTLVREALIDVPRDQGWTQGSLELVSRAPAEELVLRDLQVPVLELGDEVVTRRSSGRHSVVMRGGSSRASESSVDGGLHAVKRLQHADGSWPSGAWTTHATALNALAFLGAGYDHKVPGRYRTTLTAAIGWLALHDHASDLAGQALVALALAEAVGMTNDAQLKPHAERALAALAERVVEHHELDSAIYRRGPMVGPELLAWVAMATKSGMAAGLSATTTGRLLATVTQLLPELEGHADRDEAAVAHLVCLAFTGQLQRADVPTPPVSEWLDRVPRWLQEGRPELVYFATLGLFQYGGQAWGMWNVSVRDRLVALGDVVARSGWQAASPYPLGESGATAMLTLPLEVYYRYAQVGAAGKDDAGLFGNRQRGPAVVELPPLPSLALAARQWPVRFAAGPARLSDGQRVRVQLGRTVLPGRLTLAAVPADGPGAWRVLATVNTLPVPLLAGNAEVVVDGERLGDALVPFTEPGAPLRLALGRDDRVQVTRSEERKDDEAWNRRMRTTTVHLRVDAPPGLYASIRIDEAMPVPRDGSIQLVPLAPAMTPEELDRRLVEDPVWHIDLDLRHPPATTDLTWQLRYPVTVRPTVQRAQPEAVAIDAGADEQVDAEVEVLDNARQEPQK